MKQIPKSELTTIIAVLGLVIALLTWLWPFEPVDQTPLKIGSDKPLTEPSSITQEQHAQSIANTPISQTNTSLTIEIAQQAIGVPLYQIEEPSGFFYQGHETQILCPSGWVCTTHRPSEGKVYLIIGGEGVSFQGVDAGTFRWVNGYPLDDMVHDNPPCRLLEAERVFAGTTEVLASNFNCP